MKCIHAIRREGKRLSGTEMGFNVPFINCSAIAPQPLVFFVLPMIESMGARTTEPLFSSSLILSYLDLMTI